ncbi:MAG: type IV pilus assembly protein PilM [Parcubacteria group bacterium]|jgi:type IV pilus assembly protein PilM
MFGLFEGKNRCLGIDVGTTGIKIAELKKENNLPTLINYAISHDSGSLLQSNGLEMLDSQVVDIIKNMLKTGGFGTKRAVIAIPGFLSLITFMEIPEMPDGEIAQAIKFEAAKYIPTTLEDVSLGWEIIGGYQDKQVEGGKATGQGRKLQVMVVTVPKNAVASYSGIIKKVGLSSVAMEVENFAVIRALIGNDKGTFLITNIGAKVTEFVVVSDGVARLTRSIDVGGTEISRSLASGLGIDLQRADKLKKSSRINLLGANDEMSRLISPVLGMIIEEIKRIQEIYHKKSPLKKIDKIIFTGGTSKTHTLVEYFNEKTGIESQLGNPLSRIAIEKKYEEVMTEVAPELTTSIGLALRGLDEK